MEAAGTRSQHHEELLQYALRYTLPVQYARYASEIIVMPAYHEKKKWWSNLHGRPELIITVLYRGKEPRCSARVLKGNDDDDDNP